MIYLAVWYRKKDLISDRHNQKTGRPFRPGKERTPRKTLAREDKRGVVSPLAWTARPVVPVPAGSRERGLQSPLYSTPAFRGRRSGASTFRAGARPALSYSHSDLRHEWQGASPATAQGSGSADRDYRCLVMEPRRSPTTAR